ncbi:MAG: V-type proton ATPase subunit E [Anaerolineae bacterium]|nr:V-type proton ATPase subunit E [Anaerolineae bacterium]
MPLDAILRALDAEAERQVAAISQTTQADIARIEAETESRAEAIRRQQRAAIQAPLKAEQARLVNQAKLQALQMVLGTREELISNVLEKVAEYLADFSQSPDYADFLKRLAQETAAAIGPDQPLCLRVKRSDVELMRRTVRELGLSAGVEADLESENSTWNSGLGGLIALTGDERIGVVNTLEMRLQRAAEQHRAKIAAWLFEPPAEE